MTRPVKVTLFRKLFFPLLLLLYGSIRAFPQTTEPEPPAGTLNISGFIKDAGDSKPLSGATIEISGSKRGAISNEDGKFSIKAAIGNTLVIRMIGYEPKEYKVKGPAAGLIITLKQDPKGLKDVVIIGYQTLARRKVSAAVTSLDPKTIADIPTPTFDGLLQGRVAGLNVQNFSGEPGVSSTVVLRGNTNVSRSINNDQTSAAGKASLARAVSGPLYVIDGVPQSTDDIAALNYGNGTNTDVLA
ncbi:MAG: carboxypeptidase-like regulatory domain-containing protein, partial [Chitinophaga rupis]